MKSVDEVKVEMLKKKKWVVVGVTQDQDKFGYKIFKRLKAKGFTVYGVNPKYDEIDGEKIYKSILEIDDDIDCVSMVVSPKISIKVIDEIVKSNINYVWFQPGAFDEEVLDKSKQNKLEIVYFDCVYVDLAKI
ncbi:CoA-binding protein [Peptostreptococcaceae bacterium AGR-M142]